MLEEKGNVGGCFRQLGMLAQKQPSIFKEWRNSSTKRVTLRPKIYRGPKHNTELWIET